MAFRPASSQPQSTDLQAASSVLRPDPGALDKLSDTQADRAIHDARSAALRVMNAIRMLGPLLTQSMKVGGDEKDQALSFTQMMKSAHDLAVDAALQLGLSITEERDRWALNVLERTFSEVIAQSGNRVPTHETISALVQAAKERALEVPNFVETNEENTLTLSRIQALGPLLRAQMGFDFGRPRDSTIQELLRVLDEEVVKGVEYLADPVAGAAERRTLFSVLSQEASELLTEAWQHEGQKAMNALRQKSKPEIEAWRKANPQGLPIETVFNRFRQNMARLIKLTKQIRPNSQKNKK